MPKKIFHGGGGPKKQFFNAFKFKNEDDKRPKLGILPEEIMSYYRQVSASLEAGFEESDPSVDVKGEFLNNVYATLKDEGIQVSQNQTVSRILEALFTESKPCHLAGLFIQFCKELTVVYFDRFASHVFQSLIQYLPSMFDNVEDDETSSVTSKELKTSIEHLCSFTESHMRDVMTHTYASHVLRSFLESLGGVRVKHEVVRSRVSRSHRREKEDEAISSKPGSKALSIAFKEQFETLKEKLVRLCNFEDHLSDANYCPVLQTLLLILHKTSLTEYSKLAETIIEKTCPNIVSSAQQDNVIDSLPDVTQNEVGSYLIELLISLCKDSEVNKFYNDVFKGKLICFAVHPIANFVLQKLLAVINSADLIEEILEEISQYLEDVLAVNHIGIVTKLAEACKRVHTGQDKFLKTLMAAFHCLEPEENQLKVVPLLASLQTYEVFFKVQEFEKSAGETTPSSLLKTVNIHGSLLLQQMLQFDRPKLIVSSLLALSPGELCVMCCDKCGSHVVDAFFQSTTIWDKSKDTFLKKLADMSVNIACNRNGSRCLESIWKCSTVKNKILIAEMLTKSNERLESDQWGHFLYRNFALAKFSQRRKEWLEIQNASTKKQQLLQEILGGKKSKKRGQKQKSNPSDSGAVTVQDSKVPEAEEEKIIIIPEDTDSSQGKKRKSAALLNSGISNVQLQQAVKKKKKRERKHSDDVKEGDSPEKEKASLSSVADDEGEAEEVTHGKKRKGKKKSKAVTDDASPRKKEKKLLAETNANAEISSEEHTSKKRKRKKEKRTIPRGGPVMEKTGSQAQAEDLRKPKKRRKVLVDA